MIAWVRRTHPQARCSAVAHSFGGQAIGLAANACRLDALVTVAAPSGYWRLWPCADRWKYALLWYAGMPLITRIVGYFPAKALGFGEDLPRGVALQWARWCRRPGYIDDYAGHAAFEAPILAFSFEDDALAPRAAVDALHAHYRTAEVVRQHVRPQEAGVDYIGHFGFFRQDVVPDLWDETVRWLNGAGVPR